MIEIDFQIGPRPISSEEADQNQRVLVTIGHDFRVINPLGVFRVIEDTPRGQEEHMVWHSRAVTNNPGAAAILKSHEDKLVFKDPTGTRRPLEAEGFREVVGITETFARNIGGVLILFTDREIGDKLHHSFEPLHERASNSYRRVAVPFEYFNEAMTVVSFNVQTDPRWAPLLLRERAVYCNGALVPSGVVHVKHRMGGKD